MDTSEIEKLKKENTKLKAENSLLRFVLFLPLFVAYKLVLGKRLESSIREVKNDFIENCSDVTELNLSSFVSRLSKSSPQKLATLIEALFLWRLKRGFIVLLVALLPTLLLFQQNSLISTQTEVFQTQTTLLERQSVDVFVERSIASIQNDERIDFRLIKDIAENFQKLEPVRRKDYLNRLAKAISTGQSTSLNLRNLYRDDSSAATVTLLSQYGYLSTVLLVNELGENDQLNAHWAMIFDLNLSNSNLVGADMENICLHQSEVPDNYMEQVSKPPAIWKDLKSRCEVVLK